MLKKKLLTTECALPAAKLLSHSSAVNESTRQYSCNGTVTLITMKPMVEGVQVGACLPRYVESRQLLG